METHLNIDMYGSGADPGFPVGGAWTLLGGGVELQHGHFSVTMKELGPVGRRAPENFVQSDPLNSTSLNSSFSLNSSGKFEN